ncbi:hypothetical protein D3C84_667690 [compost metagenome]
MHEQRTHFVFTAVHQLDWHLGLLRQVCHFEQPVLGLSRPEAATGHQLVDGDLVLCDLAHRLRSFQRRGWHLNAAPVGDGVILHLGGNADRFQRVLHLVRHEVIGLEQLRGFRPLSAHVTCNHGGHPLCIFVVDGRRLRRRQLIAVETGQG